MLLDSLRSRFRIQFEIFPGFGEIEAFDKFVPVRVLDRFRARQPFVCFRSVLKQKRFRFEIPIAANKLIDETFNVKLTQNQSSGQSRR